MLILKFIEPEKKKLFFKRKNRNPFKTSGFICNNTVFNVIELYKNNISNPDVVSLLNRYKGFVLDTADNEVNTILKEYLFDSTPYVKRALLSGLCTYLKKVKNCSLFILDDDFRFSAEWQEIADYCKNIVVSGIENNDMHTFSKYCYNELGLNVFINDKIFLDDAYIQLDMNITKKQNFVELTGRNNIIIHPDNAYFARNSSAEKLMAYGVSEKAACAAVQVVPFKKIYVSTE